MDPTAFCDSSTYNLFVIRNKSIFYVKIEYLSKIIDISATKKGAKKGLKPP